MSKMLKATSVIAALFILLGAFATPALAGDGGNTATNLVFLPYESNGTNLWFQANGRVSNIGNSYFNGVKVGCRYFSDTQKVRCTLPKKFAGTTGGVVVGNLSGWVKVPMNRYCYSIWDLNQDDYDVWEEIGTYCQQDEASNGDVIRFYNSFGWDSWYYYDFFNEGNGCPGAGTGAAYYYPDCN